MLASYPVVFSVSLGGLFLGTVKNTFSRAVSVKANGKFLTNLTRWKIETNPCSFVSFCDNKFITVEWTMLRLVGKIGLAGFQQRADPKIDSATMETNQQTEQHGYDNDALPPLCTE